MKFEEALAAMRDGKRVRRRWWETSCIFLTIEILDNKLSLVENQEILGDGVMDRIRKQSFLVNSGNVLSEDWEVISDE